MTHDQLVAALQAHLGSAPQIARVIECEDLFKGALAILNDRAVHVEERLGAIMVKGTYAFADVQGIEVQDEFSGTKEVRMRVAGQSVRLGKVLPADAEALRALCLGSAPSAGAADAPKPPPVVVESEAPLAPTQPVRVSAARAMATAQAKATAPAVRAAAFSFKEPAIEAAKVAAAATVVVIVAQKLAGAFYWQLAFALQLFVIWTSYSALGSLGFGQASRRPTLMRYGFAAGAVGAGFGWSTAYFGYAPWRYALEAMVGWAIVSAGAFKARQARATWQQAAGLGAAYGFLEYFFRFGNSWFRAFLGVFAFWFLQYVAERHPQSTLR